MHLALADISTTSGDHANFVTAVNAAIGGRTDLSFDAGTGTLTYTGTGSPMPDLVINLGAVADGLVEGPEQYTVSLSSPGSTTGPTWPAADRSPPPSPMATPRPGRSPAPQRQRRDHANYTVHLAGTLQANETATMHLALADISTTSGDHANFVTAVNAAIGGRTDLSFDAGTGTLTYTGTGSPMPDLVINLGAVADGLVEGPEQYTVSLSSPGSTTGANVAGSGSVHHHHRQWRHRDLVDHRLQQRQRRDQRELHGAPGRHAAGGRDSDRASGAGRYQHHQRRPCELRDGGERSNRRAHRPELRCRHRHADLHRHRQPDARPGDQSGCGRRRPGGGPRTIHGQPVEPRQHDRRQCGRQRIGHHHHRQWRHRDLVDQRLQQRQRREQRELHGAPGRHAAGGRDSDRHLALADTAPPAATMRTS